MPVSDQLIDMRDPRIALGLLTRLPFGADLRVAADRGPHSAWAFPFVGLIIGALSAGIGALALLVGLGAGPVAVLVVLTQVMMTGAMHEDGLADSADGLWGGWDPARRLEIMKDSSIGAYGVIALLLVQTLRIMALSALATNGFWSLMAGIVAAACISRTSMVGVMTLLAPTRRDGLSASVGQPSPLTLVLAMVIAGLTAVGLIGLYTIPATIAAVVCAFVAMSLAKARIGGQTGDILGGTQQITEISVLLILTIGP